MNHNSFWFFVFMAISFLAASSACALAAASVCDCVNVAADYTSRWNHSAASPRPTWSSSSSSRSGIVADSPSEHPPIDTPAYTPHYAAVDPAPRCCCSPPVAPLSSVAPAVALDGVSCTVSAKGGGCVSDDDEQDVTTASAASTTTTTTTACSLLGAALDVPLALLFSEQQHVASTRFRLLTAFGCIEPHPGMMNEVDARGASAVPGRPVTVAEAKEFAVRDAAAAANGNASAQQSSLLKQQVEQLNSAYTANPTLMGSGRSAVASNASGTASNTSGKATGSHAHDAVRARRAANLAKDAALAQAKTLAVAKAAETDSNDTFSVASSSKTAASKRASALAPASSAASNNSSAQHSSVTAPRALTAAAKKQQAAAAAAAAAVALLAPPADDGEVQAPDDGILVPSDPPAPVVDTHQLAAPGAGFSTVKAAELHPVPKAFWPFWLTFQNTKVNASIWIAVSELVEDLVGPLGAPVTASSSWSTPRARNIFIRVTGNYTVQSRKDKQLVAASKTAHEVHGGPVPQKTMARINAYASSLAYCMDTHETFDYGSFPLLPGAHRTLSEVKPTQRCTYKSARLASCNYKTLLYSLPVFRVLRFRNHECRASLVQQRIITGPLSRGLSDNFLFWTSRGSENQCNERVVGHCGVSRRCTPKNS